MIEEFRVKPLLGSITLFVNPDFRLQCSLFLGMVSRTGIFSL
jgi:hypothetical protein